MDEATFDAQVAALFSRLVKAADGVDPDLLEADRQAEVVTLTAGSGERIVISTQRALRQIWVSALGEGVHFSFAPQPAQWVDHRGKNLELWSYLRSSVHTLCGVWL